MRKLSEQDVLNDIRACFEKHGRVNRAVLDNDNEFCSGKTVYNKFGSFSDACIEANVPHDDKPQKKEKVSVQCENCGSGKEVYPYRLEQNKNGRFFCDNDCQGEWWSQNISGESHPLYEGGGEWSDKFGSQWHVIREKCLRRDEFECQYCDMSYDEHVEEYGRGLEVHHIEPRRKFYKDKERTVDEANKMDNLITLCREHHIQAENGLIEVEP